MFGRRKKTNNTELTASAATNAIKRSPPSVISSDMNILGHIISDGLIDINGRVEGNVKCKVITLRENGRVMGDLIADVVQIYGEVEGLVKAKDVSLFETARVTGTIMHESLSIEDGAFVDGKFKRTDRVFLEDEAAFEPVDDEDRYDYDIEEDNDESVMDNIRLISG
ncbi:MAG: polymer-forming cytoskeletal protein [Rickettsiales bacterium]|nr:polymer-forming cytoskeletal protein [Rickettsiales bacterium]